MAVANYHDTNGHYPPAYVLGPDGKPWHSWRVLILPFMEQEPTFKAYRFDEPWDGPNNRLLAGRMPKNYAFPQTPAGSTTTNYLAVVGSGTVWPGAVTVTDKDVTDGTSHTILFVENLGAAIHWMEPRDLTFDNLNCALGSPQGASSLYGLPAVATLDGTVFRLHSRLKPETFRALLTIRGNEPLTNDGGWELLPHGRSTVSETRR